MSAPASTLVLLAGGLEILPTGIASTEAFGVPRVGGLVLYPEGIASTEAFGVPLVGQQNQSGFFLTF